MDKADFIENDEFHEFVLALSYTQLSTATPARLNALAQSDYSKQVKNAFYNRVKEEISKIKLKESTTSALQSSKQFKQFLIFGVTTALPTGKGNILLLSITPTIDSNSIFGVVINKNPANIEIKVLSTRALAFSNPDQVIYLTDLCSIHSYERQFQAFLCLDSIPLINRVIHLGSITFNINKSLNRYQFGKKVQEMFTPIVKDFPLDNVLIKKGIEFIEGKDPLDWLATAISAMLFCNEEKLHFKGVFDIKELDEDYEDNYIADKKYKMYWSRPQYVENKEGTPVTQYPTSDMTDQHFDMKGKDKSIKMHEHILVLGSTVEVVDKVLEKVINDSSILIRNTWIWREEVSAINNQVG